MFKKIAFGFSASLLMMSSFAFALEGAETARYFNGPTVVSIGTSSATLSLSAQVIASLTDEEKSRLYFEYGETNQVCIMMYPTPASCLPKKTELGKTSVTIEGLKANTSYTATYKRDNTIRCIMAPCPENGFVSTSVEFVTGGERVGDVTPTPTVSTDAVPITKNLFIGSRGIQVSTLQTVLLQHGYMTGTATGYFGAVTFKAVKEFQKSHSVKSTGYVGALTRAVLTKMTVNTSVASYGAEKFEGTVTAYSTSCFSDGECSITVDGKKIVTTLGWSQMIVGKVTGIADFGAIENNVGSHAKVYAKKTDTGYTLYGNADYYVDISPKVVIQSKLPAGSVVTSSSVVIGNTWVWQKTVMTDTSIVTPKTGGAFAVTFGDDGKISGTTDCNGFFGTATFATDGFMSFGPLGSTRMFCDGSQESVFTGALATTSRYSIDASGSLVLSGGIGSMYFSKK